MSILDCGHVGLNGTGCQTPEIDKRYDLIYTLVK